MQFSDVPEGSTFYAYIHGLACAGVISGYSDGTFRPNDNVTRGQAAKILANSARYREGISPDQETFEDVAPGSAFWLYVERVAAHGAISGYNKANTAMRSSRYRVEPGGEAPERFNIMSDTLSDPFGARASLDAPKSLAYP